MQVRFDLKTRCVKVEIIKFFKRSSLSHEWFLLILKRIGNTKALKTH